MSSERTPSPPPPLPRWSFKVYTSPPERRRPPPTLPGKFRVIGSPRRPRLSPSRRPPQVHQYMAPSPSRKRRVHQERIAQRTKSSTDSHQDQNVLTTTVTVDAPIEQYNVFLEECVGLLHITPSIYAIQDFSPRKQHLRLNTFYHLTRTPSVNGTGFDIHCDCPGGSIGCIHKRVMELNDWNRMAPLKQQDNDPIVYLTVSSMAPIASIKDQGTHRRAIVKMTAKGVYYCQRHNRSNQCEHTNTMRSLTETDGDEGEDVQDGEPMDGGVEGVDDDSIDAQETSTRLQRRAFSRLPIPVPAWAELDNPAPRRPFVIPERVVDGIGTCSKCGTPLIPSGEFCLNSSARLFTLEFCTFVKVIGHTCHVCNAITAPDGCELRIFNWSNTHLFSHTLLDSYTAQFTASETPFNAFITSINRAYSNNGCHEKFVATGTFEKVFTLPCS
jgi:CxC4 like cysteine cluster associated with KDZ transposases